MSNINPAPAKRSTAALAIAWLVVITAAAWGVSQTIRRSLALFTSTQPPVTAPAAAAAGSAPSPQR